MPLITKLLLSASLVPLPVTKEKVNELIEVSLSTADKFPTMLPIEAVSVIVFEVKEMSDGGLFSPVSE